MEDFLEFLRSVERKWQRRWIEDKVFVARPDPSRPKYFITFPYPYVSGPLHIGHGRTNTQVDIIARYKRIRGYNVLYPMASHVTGIPIFAISDQIRRGDQKTIELYRRYVSRYVKDPEEVERILESFKEPLNVAKFFASVIHEDFDYMGYSIDWTRYFHTAESWYNKFVEWQYYKLKEKGVITRGEHYVTYCLLHKQPVGEHDIKDGDVNPVDIVEFVGIKFKFEDGYIIASTLRPETIYGCTNLWVKPDGKYVKIKVGEEVWYVSKEAYDKIRHQFDDVELLGEFDGRYFIGKTATDPLGNEQVILPADFVDTDRATGFVYSEPSDAPYDYVALMELKKNLGRLREFGIDPEVVQRIEIKKIIEVPGVKGHHAEEVVKKMGIENQLDPRLEEATEEVYKEQYYNGKMIVEEFKGIPVKEAKERIKEKLISEGKAIIFRETSRKAICRGGGKIIIAKIRNQWFINYNIPEWKERTKDWVKRMTIIPERGRQLILNTIDWLEKRPCARTRGLGTRLPWDKEWVIESLSDSTIYMAFYTVVYKLKRYNPEQLKPELFDYIFLGIGNPEEISKLTGIPKEEIEEMRREFEYWYPLDHRHTAIDLMTNHIPFFIMHHVLIFPEKYWPRTVTWNDFVIAEGQKMSKSKGNVILLRDIAEKYSADLYRLYISGMVSWESLVDWRERDVMNVLGKIKRFYELLSKALNYEESEPKSRIENWFVNRFWKRLKNAIKAMDERFDVREYVQQIFFGVLKDIQHFLNRTESEEKLYPLIRKIMRHWLIAISPVMPHLAEELWEKLGEEPYVSKAVLPEIPEPEEKYEREEEFLKRVEEDIEEIMKVVGKKPKKIIIVIPEDWKYEMMGKVKGVFERERNIKTIMKAFMEFEGARKNAKFYQKLAKKIFEDGLWDWMEKESEKSILEEEKGYISSKFEAEVNILEESEIENEKASRALPGKPAIIFEL